MWQIGNPLYFLGLLGLIIPIVIHLYNKRKTKVKILGSLRWLTEIQPAQWHFRHIHQWPLLFIRLSLLLVAILLLVDLQKHVQPKGPVYISNLILIHPAAGDTTQYRQLAADWENEEVKAKWLKPGFPLLDDLAHIHSNYSIWSLIAEADFQFQPDNIHVIAPGRLDYFEGAIPPINASVSWELTHRKEDSLKLVDVILANDKQELLWYQSQPERTEYKSINRIENPFQENQLILWDEKWENLEVKDPNYQVSVRFPDTLKIWAEFDAALEREWYLLQNALQALSKYHKIPISIVDNHKDAHWHFWLHPNSEASVSFEKTLLKFNYNPGISYKWMEPVANNSVVIRKSLTTGNILEGGLLEELRPYFLKFKYRGVNFPDTDYRQVEISDILPDLNSYKIARAESQPAPTFRLLLGLILLTLIIIERLWPKGIK